MGDQYSWLSYPHGEATEKVFLLKREAQAFGDHMRRAYEDHEAESTYLHGDQPAEAAKAYEAIAEVTSTTGKTYDLLGIVQDFASRERLASKRTAI